MFYKAHDVVFLGELDEIQVITQELHGRLGDEDVNTVLHGKFSDGVVRVW